MDGLGGVDAERADPGSGMLAVRCVQIEGVAVDDVYDGESSAVIFLAVRSALPGFDDPPAEGP